MMKIISLNIEKDKNLERVLPFLREQEADIILLQEVLSKDISLIEETLEMQGKFAVMKILIIDKELFPFGLAIFSPLLLTYQTLYYRGKEENPPIASEGNPINSARALLVAGGVLNEKKFCLINTHFTWTPDGRENSAQHEDFPKFLQLLSTFPHFVLCGDLNAPRGRMIFDRIASLYKDNIPSLIKTTIDKDFHRAGDLQLVVDCLFSTPGYQISDVEVVKGLSDHCAITAQINL